MYTSAPQGQGSDGTPRADLSAAEKTLLDALAEMLAIPGYLFPLVAAQRQYRDHYYGLSSAALLEDLFFDSFANYLAQSRPEVVFERPGRGQKGWDYRFQGMEVSHKVGQKPQEIAALWDATVRREVWSFGYPIVYLCAGYQPGLGEITTGSVTHRVKPLSGRPTEPIGAGHRLWLVEWPATEPASVVWTACTQVQTTVSEFLPFQRLWPKLAEQIRAGKPANHFEILRSTRAVPGESDSLFPQDPLSIDFEHRSGISVFSAADLQNVPVKSNNRALLMSKETVAEKMVLARDKGLFVPMPLWFRPQAAERPPDLYLSQRADFDALFSPASRLGVKPTSQT